MYIIKKVLLFCKRAVFIFRQRVSPDVRQRRYVYIIYIYNRIKRCISLVYMYSKNKYIRSGSICCEIFLKVIFIYSNREAETQQGGW